jgi:protein phosphatase methylesterase 1
MSDLFRSALHARIAKLPDISTLALGDEDEDAEAGDAIGALPGRGLGPPAMCVLSPALPRS